MERLLISCDSCKRMWLMAYGFSIYAQQALESRPCPHCGAYTLSCEEAELAKTGDTEVKREGTYTVDGNKVKIVMKKDDKERTQGLTILKASDTELSVEGEDGKKVEFTKKK